MTGNPRSLSVPSATVEARLDGFLLKLRVRTDRFFTRLLVAEWLVCVVLAIVVSPRAWEGRASSVHPHVWAALFLGGAIVAYPAWLGLRRSGYVSTRHLLAVAQMLLSSLLIHLTGGRIETHFHIFGSLALLAFYRDPRVLLTATAVTFADHFVRGLFWPESVYGVFAASPWRSLEHVFWVLFEVVFLWISIQRGIGDGREVARRQLSLEALNGEMEQAVSEQTRELRRTEERFRALFEESPIGLYRAAPDGLLQLANPTLLQMLGYASREELRAAGVRLQNGAEDTEHRAFLAEAAAKGQVHGRDAVWKRRDGSPLFVRESVRVLRDARGEISFFDGSVEDVTERRKLEERYLQAQKVQAVGQLAGGVAHDFNNILTAMLGYAEFLVEAPELDPLSREYAGEIKLAGERASALTRQLLAFSRQQSLQPRVFSVNQVVAEMDAMLRRLVGEHIAIQSRPAPDLGAAKADPGQIQQVVLNLAVNARDAMPEGGRLVLETSNVALDADYCRLHPEAAPGEYVCLAVTDTGTGITPEVKARLFEPFFTTKEQGQGTGLGLATCHGIVKQSGGHITVHSTPGHGATFRVYIPRAAEPLTPVAVSVKGLRGVRGGGESILFVEDEAMVRLIGVRVLRTAGYRVTEAGHGGEALERLAEFPGGTAPDLLVTDVVMPEMGGPELVKRLRALFPRTRVLYTSGYTGDALGTERFEEGTYFLAKPYSMAVLATRVREILDGTASRSDG